MPRPDVSPRPRPGAGWAGLALGLALAGAACNTSAAQGPEVHRVTIHGMAFAPAALTVAAGDVVVWTNTDVVPHTVTAPGRFDSGPIAPQQAWRYVAATHGDFAYACTLHPTMTARLVVHQ